MAERSFEEEVKKLRLAAGEEFQGEGILAITKALLQSGVSYVAGYQGAPISHLMDVLADANDILESLAIHFENSASEATATATAKPVEKEAVVPAKVAASAAAATPAKAGAQSPAASPSASKIAAEKGIDTSTVAGTGRDGRVTKGDVLAPSPAPAAAKATPLPIQIPTGSRTSFQTQFRSRRTPIFAHPFS